MPAAKYNLLIEQGATFRDEIIWDQDTTGYIARMKVRNTNTDAVVIDLTTTPNVNGDAIILSGNTINIYISAASTAGYSFSQARYDLELVNGTEVPRLIEGMAYLSTESTK